jgi:hypothetical protein
MLRLARAHFFFAIMAALFCAGAPARADLNAMVVEALNTMPLGGSYSVSKRAFDGLTRSISLSPTGLSVAPEAAQPSFCSGATYLVFVQVIERLQREGALALDPQTLAALPVAGQRDGQGLWGRWNANGPGTARLFTELQLGRNFTDFAEARPGDFMKVFWTSEIGKKERGHSVIFMGSIPVGGREYVRFWSSNLPSVKGDLSGYGVKLVPRTKMARVIFSRLERPANLSRALTLPKIDTFLASMLTRSATFDEVRKMCAF